MTTQIQEKIAEVLGYSWRPSEYFKCEKDWFRPDNPNDLGCLPDWEHDRNALQELWEFLDKQNLKNRICFYESIERKPRPRGFTDFDFYNFLIPPAQHCRAFLEAMRVEVE